MRDAVDKAAAPLNLLSPAHLQHLLDAVAQAPGLRGIMCLDRQYRYLYFNQLYRDGVREAYGTEIELGRSALDFITVPEDYQQAKGLMERALAGEVVEEVRRFGLSRSYYKSHYRPLRDDKGEIFGLMIVTTDLTERRRIQRALERQVALRTRELKEANQKLQREIAERRQAEEALRASEQRFRNTFEQSTSAIVLLDKQLHIRRTNRAFTELTGFQAEEARGRLLAPLLGIEESGFEEFERLSPLEEGQNWRQSFVIRDKDGREVEVSLTIAGLYDGRRQLVEYITTLRDITLHRKLEKAQQQFMRSLSHEIRTPLTNLILYIDLLNKKPQKLEYLQILNQQVERLQSLVNGVLEITSLTLSKGAVSWSNYHLATIVKAAVAANFQLAKTNRIRFEIQPLPPNLPMLTGDTVRLTQAFRELIKNAASYSREGGAVRIEVEHSPNEEETPWIRVRISDDGLGIAEDELDYIFENFYRGQEVERHNIAGAGLGLPIALAIVKAHGGRITVESRPGLGSDFTVWLATPLGLVEAARRPSP